MKKAIVNQAFTFLSAAIIVGIILLFASQGIIKLVGSVKEVESAQFEREFEQAINSMSSRYGSVEYIELPGISDFQFICIVDLNQWGGNPLPAGYSSTQLQSYSLIRGELQDKTANVFLINKNVDRSFLNTNLMMDPPGYGCREVPRGGSLEVKLEGLGKQTRLSFVS